MNAYIVFILKIGEDLVSGYTTDINTALTRYENQNKRPTLVYQQHFDELDKAKNFANELEKWDNQKKEELINGRINFS